jgi:hypothetical protein
VGEHLIYLPSFGYCLLLAPRLEADAAGWPRLRPKLALVAALVIGVALARTLAFGALARASRQTIDDALDAWDAAPRAATLLVVDLPGPAALGFAHALRGARPDRPPEVEILTLSPQALPGGAATTSRIEWEGVSRFVLRRDQPLLGSYIERAFAGDRASFADGESVTRDGLTVTVRDVRDGRPQALEVSLAPDRPALLLRAEGYRLRGAAPAR